MIRALLVLWLSALPLLAAGVTIHVSFEGNDDWSGEEPVAGADKDRGPVRTFARALERSRGVPATSRPVTISLPAGRHVIDRPISLGSDDAGLIVTSLGTNRAVLSGGIVITNWQRDPKNARLWHADIEGARNGRWNFRQLFVSGQRKIRARHPNSGYLRINGASPQDKPVKINFHGEDIKPIWAERGDVELIAYLAWADLRMRIRHVDAANRIATLSGDPRPSNKENNAQYHLENAPEFLDAPGEWYLDTQAGRVSFWADGAENLNSLEVIAPLLEDLVVITGDPERPARDITFRNVEFSHTNWLLGEHGYADTQAAVAIRGDLRAEYAEDCIIEDCRFSHLAGYAIDVGRGCKRFKIVGNELYDVGGGGVRLGETARPRVPSEENHSHQVTDNHLHQLGRVYPPAVGVFILQSATNRVAHNHIHDLYYTAVSVGWNWGYQDSPCRANIVEFNHMHDIGQNLLSDMGAVYTLGPQPGTIIRNNLIHDVSSFNYGGWGLYTDEGSSGIVMENNVVYRCKSAGFHQHYGRENILRNNIFAFNKETQLMRTRAEPHISFIFTNNIVYFDSGDLLGSNWSNDNYVIDHNIYFDERLRDVQQNMMFSGVSLEEWRKRGHDVNSVLFNPNFVARKPNEFTLQPDSPALSRGFKQIDVTRVGPRPPAARR